MSADPDVSLLEGDESKGASHTVILGWSNKIPSLLRHLVAHNHNEPGGQITVVAAVEMEQMEVEIQRHNKDLVGTSLTLICGSRLDTQILRKASIDTASAVIILAESQDAEETDELAVIIVRKILKVVDIAHFRGHIVVEVHDVENEPWIKQAGRELVETVVAKDVITRLMVQCARQPGLAQVWRDILGSEKAEFYIQRWPELEGMCFADVLISFPDAIPCGVKVASRRGKIVLNPDDEYILGEGDEVLVIAADHDSYTPSITVAAAQACPLRSPMEIEQAKPVKKILFCGWQSDMDDMVSILDHVLGRGSELWIFSEELQEEREKRFKEKDIAIADLKNVDLSNCTSKATRKKDLEALPLETFDSILLVADGGTSFNVEQELLSTLILIKSIQASRMPYREARAVQILTAGNNKSFWIDELQHNSAQSIIVSEVLNAHTKEALGQAGTHDFREIEISDDMVSMALAMVAEDKRIGGVLDELFAEQGNVMVMRPAEVYFDQEEELSFYDIMVRGRQNKEIVIGYHSTFEDTPVINPCHKALKKKWSLLDSFIVLVEQQ